MYRSLIYSSFSNALLKHLFSRILYHIYCKYFLSLLFLLMFFFWNFTPKIILLFYLYLLLVLYTFLYHFYFTGGGKLQRSFTPL
jgi:hypothetical protein